MHAAAERLVTDVTKAGTEFRHDGCPTTSAHVGNARRAARPSDRYVLRKASVSQKIDLAVVSILAHEAAGDAVAAGEARSGPESTVVVMR
jgi:phage terminase large subunit-like protein